jgi:hypothetical protein
MSRQIPTPANPDAQQQRSAGSSAMRKRVVFTKVGKGGVGKTGFMVNLAEWFIENEVPFTLLDLDTENKARGSLKHYFSGTAHKVSIHTEAGLDAFVDYLSQITRRNLKVQPTIKVPVGYQFTVRVNRDIPFDAPYEPIQPEPQPLIPEEGKLRPQKPWEQRN